MSIGNVRTPLSAEILDQAAAWFVEFQEGAVDHPEREEFLRWLRASPEHVRGYLEIAATWEDAEQVDRAQSARADVLIARALAQGNVVPLDNAAGPDRDAPQANAASGAEIGARRRFAVAAVLAALSLVGGWSWYAFLRPATYATDIGEQRSIRLADGSTVDINSRSRIRVRYDETHRLIELIEGQALFRVAKDAARPFTVESGGTIVRAVGTRFDVYRRTEGTTVTVLEGRVSVVGQESAAARSPTDVGPLLVAAGEQVIVTATTLTRPQPANVAATTAWTRGELVFEATPLAEVAAEFNRYNSRRLVIADERIAGTRISGVFSSTDPSAFLLFLRGLPEYRVEEEGDTIRITGR